MEEGEHYETRDTDSFASLKVGEMVWPIIYNDWLIPDKSQEIADNRNFAKIRWYGLKRKIRMFDKQ